MMCRGTEWFNIIIGGIDVVSSMPVSTTTTTTITTTTPTTASIAQLHGFVPMLTGSEKDCFDAFVQEVSPSTS